MAKLTVDTERMATVGENVQALEVEGKLVIVIDLAGDAGLSSTGKMHFVGQTGGFQRLPGGLSGSVMVGRKVQK